MHRILPLAIALFACTSVQAGDVSLASLIERLGSPDTGAQMAAARALADSGDERAIPALEAMVAGQLYARRSDGSVVIARREGRGYELFNPLSGEPLGTAGRRDVSRIALQGAERDAVRRMLVALELGAGDVDARRAALDAMMDEPGAIPLDVVRRRLEAERDRGARRRLEALLLLATLDTGSTEARIDAARALAGFSHPSVRARLQALADDAGTPPALADAATAALRTLDRRQGINQDLQTVFFGLSLGSVLVLAAIGLAITFGVMGVINMAHGELIMLGAYTAWGVQALLPDAVGLALILA
ncbi:MAG: hypothetical protein V2I25_08080, partial [Woeseiaceae bacterium]|nr:hypothetical protein [Woeseiaceae bacterium]